MPLPLPPLPPDSWSPRRSTLPTPYRSPSRCRPIRTRTRARTRRRTCLRPGSITCSLLRLRCATPSTSDPMMSQTCLYC
jgi:hypothetical protein